MRYATLCSGIGVPRELCEQFKNIQAIYKRFPPGVEPNGQLGELLLKTEDNYRKQYRLIMELKYDYKNRRKG